MHGVLLAVRRQPQPLQDWRDDQLFRIAQYFGWTEILRRDIQFLSFPETDETRRVVTLQPEIAKRFGTSRDDHGHLLCDLVLTLDAGRLRYKQDFRRA